MKIGFLAMSGIRAHDAELLRLGLTLPGFVERSKTIASLPSLGLLYLAAATPDAQRHELRYFEAEADHKEPAEVYACDLVAISTFSAQVFEAYAIADRLRAAEENAPSRQFDSKDFAAVDVAKLPVPRYDLLDLRPYNRFTVQTSRGCHQGCTFCAEPLMNGLKFRYRPVDEVIREVETCGSRMISINDADFFGTPERPKEVMRALIGRGVHWQAGVTSKLAQDDAMLELAAKSGCTMLSIGFESISRNTLKSVHKHVNRPDQFAALVEKVHSYGIMVFGLFMFGFDTDDENVFQETAKFNIDADYDACAYSVLTPYPGTLTWYEMKKADRIVSFDWEKYDQANVVYRPAGMTGDALRLGHISAYQTFYAPSSIARRFPLFGKRSRFQWTIYNLFMKKGSATDRKDAIASPTAAPDMAPVPPILPIKREWRQSVLEAIGEQEPAAGGPARLGIQ